MNATQRWAAERGIETYKPDDVLRVKARELDLGLNGLAHVLWLKRIYPEVLNPNLIYVTENGVTEVWERVKA